MKDSVSFQTTDDLLCTVKIFVAKEKELPRIRLLRFLYGEVEGSAPLFQNTDPAAYAGVAQIVLRPTEADFILVPHDYQYWEFDRAYRRYLNELHKQTGKKLLVVLYGDKDRQVDLPGSLALRTSAYRYKICTNDVVIPPFVEDLGQETSLRHKADRPSVGFVGWAMLRGPVKRWIYLLKLLGIEVMVLFTTPRARAKKQGIYFRQEALDVLRKSAQVDLCEIVRSAYSANRESITLDPAIARREYIDTMRNTDFTLAPKGDGNYSLRFYEALSMGRIPILLDTECVLPLEGEIEYDSFIIRVPYEQIDTLPERLGEIYRSLSDKEFLGMQAKALEVFRTKLQADRFYRILFSNLAREARRRV
jgi:hypothetical protein